MYVGVDVGATKTLLAVLNHEGLIKEKIKFPTPGNYEDFLLELERALAGFEHQEFFAGAVGIAGVIDRHRGRRLPAGKLKWDNVPVQADAENIFHCPMLLENDAKLAGLSEAMMVKHDYKRVLYITISTGIGYALIVDGVIDTSIGDQGGTNLMVEYKGKRAAWESIASGRAIVERTGKKAEDITDDATWRTLSRDFAKGIVHLIAITDPQTIIIGGSVGTYFDRYHKLLVAELKKYELPTLKLPPLRQAQRPEEAVVYGCYDLAKQKYPHHAQTIV
jgi:predicted NBD/HSP70 family sugar kinase